MLHYTHCGLDNVWLRNGYHIHDEGVSIERIEELHAAIRQVEDPDELIRLELEFSQAGWLCYCIE
jgi:hypothetical protein